MLSDTEISDCFGALDYLFAIHPMDADHAFELLIRLRSEQALWSDVRSAFEDFLKKSRCTPTHIRLQMGMVRMHFAPWLHDG